MNQADLNLSKLVSEAMFKMTSSFLHIRKEWPFLLGWSAASLCPYLGETPPLALLGLISDRLSVSKTCCCSCEMPPLNDCLFFIGCGSTLISRPIWPQLLQKPPFVSLTTYCKYITRWDQRLVLLLIVNHSMQFSSFVFVHPFSVKSMQRDPVNETPCVSLGWNEILQTLWLSVKH